MAETTRPEPSKDLQNLPKVDVLAESDALKSFPRKVRVQAARNAIEAMRASAKSGEPLPDASATAVTAAQSLSTSSLQPAINLSGVILHTGLGRARLAPSVIRHLIEIASGHATVEFDIESGGRGDRQEHVRDLLCELTGAEEALAVNNCAAAVVLSLAALAAGREVLLSRGQMVEIGGSFRMPDIVEQSGCKLIELGCTNKTRLSDYEKAITEETAAILRCHPSNFRIVGFSAEPSAVELAGLAKRRGLILVDDMGSGCLVDTTQFGLPKEATLQDGIKSGADVVLSSGDKLLGGPQAGIILGKAEIVSRIKLHPLARAFRIDKLTLASLEASLRLYRSGRETEIPTLQAMARSAGDIRRVAARLSKAFPGKSEVRAAQTEVGGGAAPGTALPSFAAVLLVENPEEIARALRKNDPPIIGRIHDRAVWLDPRTLEKDEITVAEQALRRLEC